MRAYPLAKRLAVLRACDAGKTTSQVAKEFRCSPSWVRRVKQRRREGRLVGPRLRRHRRCHPTPRWVGYQDDIEALIEKDPEMTLRELKEALDTDLSLSTLSRALKQLRL